MKRKVRHQIDITAMMRKSKAKCSRISEIYHHPSSSIVPLQREVKEAVNLQLSFLQHVYKFLLQSKIPKAQYFIHLLIRHRNHSEATSHLQDPKDM